MLTEVDARIGANSRQGKTDQLDKYTKPTFGTRLQLTAGEYFCTYYAERKEQAEEGCGVS